MAAALPTAEGQLACTTQKVWLIQCPRAVSSQGVRLGKRLSLTLLVNACADSRSSSCSVSGVMSASLPGYIERVYSMNVFLRPALS